MKNLTAALLALALLVGAPAPGLAEAPLPAAQRTPRAELWLARAFVGEAGFTATRDHAGMAWVLVRRWRRMVKRWPSLSFVTVVQNYAHALGFKRRGSLTRRQVWVRGLLGPERPEGWPSRWSWPRWRPHWRQALERSRQWFDGELADPCRGRAWNWGGAGLDDHLAIRKRLNPVDCGETANTFYDDGEDDDDQS